MTSLIPKRTEDGHYAVDYRGRPYEPAGSFDYIAHDRWVEAGHCPVVSIGKNWCCKAPHPASLAHGSPFVPAEDRTPAYVEWEM